MLPLRVGIGVPLCFALTTTAIAEKPYPGRPQASPVSAATAFDPALRCMDDLLSRTTIGSGYYFVPEKLEDPGGKMGVTRDMILDAANKMSLRSHFFKIVFDPTKGIPPGSIAFKTGGSITSLDEGVENRDKGAGLSVAKVVGATVSRRNNLSNLTVSLYLVDNKELLVPGTFHAEQIVLRTSTKSGLVTGVLSFLNGSLSLNTSDNDGPQAATKALIDLGMIQAVGNLAQVPYASCLAKVTATADVSAQAWDRYRRMTPLQRAAAITAEMVARGLSPANPSSAQLSEAIAVFERSQNMTPSGKVRFELYEALQKLPVANVAANRPAGGKPAVRVAGSGAGFYYNTGRTYPITYYNNKLVFDVTVAEPAYVACYYTDATNTVTRVFPNTRRPSYLLAAGEKLRIPNDQDDFVIKPLVKQKAEWMTCIAGRDDFLSRISSAVPNVGLPEVLPGITSAKDLVKKAEDADSKLSIDTMTYFVQ